MQRLDDLMLAAVVAAVYTPQQQRQLRGGILLLLSIYLPLFYRSQQLQCTDSLTAAKAPGLWLQQTKPPFPPSTAEGLGFSV